MADERTRSRDQRVTDVYDYLAAHGTPGDRDDLTIAKAAAAIGTSRSSLYGYWPSSAAFAEDVIVFQAMPPGSWQHRLAERWDDLPLGQALTEAIQVDAGDSVLRSSLSVRPRSSLARAQVAAWERAWLDRFAERLRATHGAHPDEPWTDIAVSLAGLVEGMFLLRRMLAGSPDAPSPEHAVELTVSTVERMAPYLAANARGDAGPLRAPADEPIVETRPTGASRILASTVKALGDGRLEHDATDRRLVDMAALARQQGVTSRSLYKTWPTATDLNADLFGECVRRVRAGITSIGLETFITSAGGGFNYFTPLLLHINEQVLRVEVFPDSRPFIAMIELATNPDVLARHGGTIHEWFTEGQMFAAALLQASGRTALPGFSLADHTWLAVASELGAWRMSAMHEGLMERVVHYLGHDVIALAAGIDAHTEVWSEHDEVPSHERTVPPLPG